MEQTGIFFAHKYLKITQVLAEASLHFADNNTFGVFQAFEGFEASSKYLQLHDFILLFHEQVSSAFTSLCRINQHQKFKFFLTSIDIMQHLFSVSKTYDNKTRRK